MKITLLYNAVADADSAADRDVLVQVAAVEEALQTLGHSTRRLAATLNLEVVEESLTSNRPDLVFNLVESLAGSDRLAHLAGVLLEDLDLRYTGAPASALHLASNKPRAKERMQAAGLPTPGWVAANACTPASLAPPYIIKAAWEHASLGLDDHAVIQEGDGSTVCDQIASRSRHLGQPCFAEQFIDGREFNLSVIAADEDPRVLPPAEIDFAAFPAGKPKIVGYAAKWDDQAMEFSGTPRTFDFPAADTPLLARLAGLALDCWRLFELAGYARVDFRVDSRGQPWILEVNANPCLSPDAGFAAALCRAEIPFERAIEWIVNDALRKKEEPGARGQGPGANHSPLTTHHSPPSGKKKKRSFATKLRTEVRNEDCEIVRRIVTDTGLFRAGEIDVAVELVQARLEKGPASGYEFVFAEQKGQVVGYICFGRNSITVSSFDVYWIAVEPNKQGQGLGQLLLEAAERQIAAVGGTRIYIETSHRADYQATRGFYDRCGYHLASVLDDFYAPGDSKATYVKVLDTPIQTPA
jgi:D-alanine-D-alanine ligase-like ATP-grasp enzyme/GNAT superfamily N-acetyltransferase